MYSTCLFCHASLGANEAIEHFPVGRRLAFDAAKGRLWVVCRACERWSLSPLEERWEAIEECERLFSGTKLRVSTDQVGLARLREGTTLVRIGAPQRPELAAWRYGDQFGRRRRKHLIVSATVVAVVGGLAIGGLAAGVMSVSAINLVNGANSIRKLRTIAQLSIREKTIKLNRAVIDSIQLRPHELFDYEIVIPRMRTWRTRFTANDDGRATPMLLALRGEDALAVARVILPHVNASGGSLEVVNNAVSLLESVAGTNDIFGRLASDAYGGQPNTRSFFSWGLLKSGLPHRLSALPPAARLALEMALHEEDERRALTGELDVLEARWKEAEEIAAISDDMFLPSSMLDRLRGGDGSAK